MVIIASSASVFEVNQQKSITAGANDFLPKPVQFEQLLALLEKHLHLEWVYEELPTFHLQPSPNSTQVISTNSGIYQEANHGLSVGVNSPQLISYGGVLNSSNQGNNAQENSLVPPPPEELEKLWDLAMRGNIQGIEQAVNHLEKIDKKYLPLANKVKQLTRKFQIRKIRDLLKSFQDEPH